MIRNITIPHLHKFLKNSSPRNTIDHEIIHMHKATEMFCKKNKDLLFIRADKGNITVDLDKPFYIEKNGRTSHRQRYLLCC